MAGRRTAAGILVAGMLALAGPAPAATLAISCGAVGQELEQCRTGAEAWARQTGNAVKVVSTPNSATERLALYQQILAARSPDIDVLQIDVIWPGILAPHLRDLTPTLGGEAAGHFPALVANDTVGGKLVALPWFMDAGLLYYRTDLLQKYGVAVPETWADLTAAAARIQAAERAAGHNGVWGYVWQGRAYEGLTCNALEWIASHGGGTVVDGAGKVTVDNPAAVRALETARGWVDTISPPGVLTYAEEEARGLFQSGRAVFMRNWPYAWSLAQGADSSVKGKVGVAALPRGPDGRPAAALGGQHLAVSKYSAHPALAMDLVRHLTGRAEQKRRALEASFNPTRPDLYDDREVAAANPFMASLRATFQAATPRPSTITGARYNRVSQEFFTTVSLVLGGGGADPALEALAARLNRIKRRGW
ncbi:MAG: ABC transporter substrate-binding protein [Hyphomicrobiales bacterium]|nr:ABC transporter substrate-binding protein [Hyphomicrobiales bacterium]MCP5374387.1 ABC transporter substrate-binding protein [Hyphomicrobiales bacterium]